jgi:hypothetical protein
MNAEPMMDDRALVFLPRRLWRWSLSGGMTVLLGIPAAVGAVALGREALAASGALDSAGLWMAAAGIVVLALWILLRFSRTATFVADRDGLRCFQPHRTYCVAWRDLTGHRVEEEIRLVQHSGGGANRVRVRVLVLERKAGRPFRLPVSPLADSRSLEALVDAIRASPDRAAAIVEARLASEGRKPPGPMAFLAAPGAVVLLVLAVGLAWTFARPRPATWHPRHAIVPARDLLLGGDPDKASAKVWEALAHEGLLDPAERCDAWAIAARAAMLAGRTADASAACANAQASPACDGAPDREATGRACSATATTSGK